MIARSGENGFGDNRLGTSQWLSIKADRLELFRIWGDGQQTDTGILVAHANREVIGY
jgi:hypothetical protein